MHLAQKRERYKRFWQPLTKGEGAYIAIESPVDDTGVPVFNFTAPASFKEQILSLDYCLKRAEAQTANTYWGLDAVNNAFVSFGPGVQAALLGAPYVFQGNTIWFDMDPPIKNWDKIPALSTNRNHVLYVAIDNHTRALCAASKGRYAVSYTDIGGQMDVLFSLRGEDLLSDFIEYPDMVISAEERISDEFISYFYTLTGIIGPSGCGYTGWIPIIGDAPWYPLQCDMCVMISPKMFEKFILPSLDKVSKAIGRSIYHLDGPGEIQHLDMLCSLKYVNAIQWVPIPNAKLPGYGGYSQDFADEMSIEVYRRVLAAGKKVVLVWVKPDQAKTIFNAVGCDGVYMNIICQTRKEADELESFAQKNWIR